jgi:hypothetical protein
VRDLLRRSQTLVFISHSQREYSDQTLTSTGNQLFATSRWTTARHYAQSCGHHQNRAAGQDGCSPNSQRYWSTAQRSQQPQTGYEHYRRTQNPHSTAYNQCRLFRPPLKDGEVAEQEHQHCERHDQQRQYHRAYARLANHLFHYWHHLTLFTAVKLRKFDAGSEKRGSGPTY